MNKLKSILEVLKVKRLWIHVLAIAAAILLSIFIVSWWLGSYTHHGQELVMPDYIGTQLDKAQIHAEDKTFEIIVTDSLFIVGKSGGEILNQTPTADSKVKEGRKIFVTVSKHDADQIPVAKLPILYGKNYERKKKELKQGYELKSKVVDYSYDPGPANHILSVIYNGDTIITKNGRKNDVSLEKGGTLEFILSKKGEGQLDIPDLLCMTYREARFLLESYEVDVQVFEDGGITNLESSYVWRQTPSYSSDGKIRMGSLIELYVTQYRPSFCPDSDGYN